MDTRDSPRLALDALEEAKFDLLQGAIVIDARGLRFWAARGVRNLFLGVGRCFDFTCGVGGADRLYLRGSGAEHRVCVAGDELTLRHEVQATEVRLHATRGPRELVFDDGAVELGALWRSARQASALLGVLGEESACARATVASHVKVSPRMAVGALPAGALIQVEGAAGVETLYAGEPGARVLLEGRLAEHTAANKGLALALARRANGLMDAVYVVGPACLVFDDGAVMAPALSRAVRFNEPWPVPMGERVPALPRITAVALDVDSADIDWSAEWHGSLPSGLFAGCRAGQVFEASVSLEVPVEVHGFPRLHLCVGGYHRAAQFSSGSGTNTLHFVYTVCEEDVAQGAGSETRGLTLTTSGNLDVEVGPLLTCGAAIRPLQPVGAVPVEHAGLSVVEMPDESTWQALITESDRKLAMALERLEDDHVARARTSRLHPIDVEVDLFLDVDLSELEQVAEMA